MTERAPADAQAFAEWVRPHVSAMARLAARLAPDADRDDVVQEALTRAWLNRDRYDAERGAPSSWLLAITADQARKASWRRRPWPLAAGRASSVDLEGRFDLERALRRLTPRQRLAVDCFYFADLSVADTAAVMRCTDGTVKSTLADARAKLRAFLEVSA
ncbi:MAG TPA: sigma-70 family RNA polymerase sigma factor [Micromonosporaceae bacterium]|nr:sigma-70 family RNA polymerase sigma factor [Micromonosporaceae bacterium]